MGDLTPLAEIDVQPACSATNGGMCHGGLANIRPLPKAPFETSESFEAMARKLGQKIAFEM